jgi:ArsR family transcriptional regulator, virulence genes transcriptional regulator
MNVVSRNIKPDRRHVYEGLALETAAIIFSNLSNTVRLSVLVRLVKREWSVNELAAAVEIGQSALSQHLAKLRDAGLVRTRKDRQTVFYHCSDDTVIRLLAEAGLTH